MTGSASRVFLLAVFGGIFPREDIAVLALEGAEEL